jgi:hypothetical protein
MTPTITVERPEAAPPRPLRRHGEPRAAGEVRRGWHVQQPDGPWHLVESATELASGHMLLVFRVGAIAYVASDRLPTCTPAEWIARHEDLQQAADAELAAITALCEGDQ